MHSEVKTYYLTPEELAAYIEKHPIVEERKPMQAELAKPISKKHIERSVESQRKSRMGRPTIMDKVDHDKVYKLYMDGLTYEQMAKELGISEGSVQKYISRKQFHDPEGWPPRLKRKVKEG